MATLDDTMVPMVKHRIQQPIPDLGMVAIQSSALAFAGITCSFKDLKSNIGNIAAAATADLGMVAIQGAAPPSDSHGGTMMVAGRGEEEA